MRLKSLRIDRGYLSDNPLTGEIVFQTGAGTQELKMVLDEALSRQIVALCADAIVKAGQDAAGNLVADVLAIEHKSDD